MATLRKIKEAALQLGTSDQTLRVWSNEFRVFMSPTAAPPSGVVREFNDVDLRLLAVVRLLNVEALVREEQQVALTASKPLYIFLMPPIWSL